MTKRYFFIDESGDPSFYAKRKRLLVGQEGFQPMLIVGMVSLTDKQRIRQTIVDFQDSILADPLYNSIPTIANPKGWFLHARSDPPDVRSKFFELLRAMKGYKTYITIGRKRLDLFHKKHNSNEKEFYFDLIYHMMKDRLNKEDEYYQVFLSSRKKSTQENIRESVEKAVERDNSRRKVAKHIQFNCEVVRSKDTPELSIIDYMLWALQRYILNNDGRFYEAMIDRYNLIIDLYDFEKYSKGKGSNYYSRNNHFDLAKASAFRSDGYIRL